MAANMTPSAEKALSSITVSVNYSPAPRTLHSLALQLPAQSTVSDALKACQDEDEPHFAEIFNNTDHAALSIGISGKRVSLEQVLQPQDRVEIYRPLRVDPKIARRERFKKQGARSAGLFAQRRPGAKPGY